MPVDQLDSDTEVLVLLVLQALFSPRTHSKTFSQTTLSATARALFLLRVITMGRGTSFTERDLYYACPALFGAQGQRSVHQSLGRLCVLMDVAAFAPRPVGAATASWEGARETVLAHLLTDPAKALLEAEQLVQEAEERAAHQPTDATPPSLRCPRRHPSRRAVGYTREQLRVTAAPRSILVGPITFCYGTSTIAVGRRGVDGLLISHDVASMCHDFVWESPSSNSNETGHTDAGEQGPALVFIEKECTLRQVLGKLAQRSGNPPTHRLLFLCTKGYPCVASRLFLRRLHAAWPHLRLVALVDGDPHGLQILLTLMLPMQPVTHGGGTRSRGRDVDVKSLLPVRWLGVKPSVVAGTPSRGGPSAMMSLTERDAALLKGLRQRLGCLLDSVPDVPGSANTTASTVRDLQDEVLWMTKTGLKCELQAITPVELLLSYYRLST